MASSLVPTHTILVDVTVYHGGFHGDLNETLFVGNVDEGSRNLVRTAYECMMKGIEVGEWIDSTATPLERRTGRHFSTLSPYFPPLSYLLSPLSLIPSLPSYPTLSSSWEEVS